MRDNPEEIANNLVNDIGLDGAMMAVNKRKTQANYEGDYYQLSVWREVMTILRNRVLSD